MSLRNSLKFLIPALMVFVSLGSAPAQAALPADLGDFRLDFTTDSPSSETAPGQSCLINSVLTSDQTEIGMAMFGLQVGDEIACTSRLIATSNASADRATVTNDILGLTGSAVVVCDFQQIMDASFSFGLKDIDSVPTMFIRYTGFEVSGMQSCSWLMTFNDAKKSSLVGDLVSPVTSSTSFDEANGLFIVSLDIQGAVNVTGGSGRFAGVKGTASFSQSGSLSFPTEELMGGEPLSARNAPQPYAAEDQPPVFFNDMVLIASKGGGIKIVSPPLTTPTKRAFGVVAGKAHKIRLVTAPGSTCNVFAKMGTKTIKLTPKALVTKTGVLSTSFTAASVAGKFGYKKATAYKNKKGQLKAVCNAGVKKKNISTSVAFTFANS